LENVGLKVWKCDGLPVLYGFESRFVMSNVAHSLGFLKTGLWRMLVLKGEEVTGG
jgi:hypothetical protein